MIDKLTGTLFEEPLEFTPHYHNIRVKLGDNYVSLDQHVSKMTSHRYIDEVYFYIEQNKDVLRPYVEKMIIHAYHYLAAETVDFTSPDTALIDLLHNHLFAMYQHGLVEFNLHQLIRFATPLYSHRHPYPTIKVRSISFYDVGNSEHTILTFNTLRQRDMNLQKLIYQSRDLRRRRRNYFEFGSLPLI